MQVCKYHLKKSLRKAKHCCSSKKTDSSNLYNLKVSNS